MIVAEIIKKNKKAVFIIECLLFFLVLYLIHRPVMLYHDDYGYGSISYNYDGNVNGMSWGISDLLTFMYWHYFNFGGRIFCFFILSILLKAGVRAIQIVQTFVIFGILLCSYELVKREKYDLLSLTVVLSVSGIYGYRAMAEGFFWYTASVTYVWSYFILLLALVLLKAGKKNRVAAVFAPICMFFAGGSYEQTGVAVVGICVVLLVVDIIQKKYVVHRIVAYICGIAGTIFEMAAPGNFVRLDFSPEFNELSLFGKIAKNFPNIFIIYYNKYLPGVVVLLAIAGILLAVWSKRKSILIANACLFALSLVGIFLFPDSSIHVLFAALYVFAILAEMVVFFISNKQFMMLAILIGAILSQAMLVVSPVLRVRSSIPFQILFHVAFAALAVTLFSRVRMLWCGVGIAVVTAFSILTVYTVMTPFFDNYYVNISNDESLRLASEQLKAGEAVEKVFLMKLPNTTFVPCMPYNQGYEYIDAWMKNYYEIPQNVTFEWVDWGV